MKAWISIGTMVSSAALDICFSSSLIWFSSFGVEYRKPKTHHTDTCSETSAVGERGGCTFLIPTKSGCRGIRKEEHCPPFLLRGGH